MNIQEQLKQTQGQREVSKFRPTRLDVKNLEGKIVFRMWDGEKNVDIDRPITKAILLGQANQLEGFDNDLNGGNGGTWVSSYYHKNDQTINLYAPGNSKPHHKGTKSELLGKVGSGVTLKSKKILFVLTEKGLFAVKTNMGLAIGQLNRLNTATNFIKLTPTLYTAEDQTIPADTHKFYNKAVVKKNPPAFASLEEDGALDKTPDWTVGDMSVSEIIAEFAKFQDRIKGDSNESGEPSQEIQKTVDKNVDEINKELADAVDSSDLPF